MNDVTRRDFLKFSASSAGLLYLKLKTPNLVAGLSDISLQPTMSTPSIVASVFYASATDGFGIAKLNLSGEIVADGNEVTEQSLFDNRNVLLSAPKEAGIIEVVHTEINLTLESFNMPHLFRPIDATFPHMNSATLAIRNHNVKVLEFDDIIPESCFFLFDVGRNLADIKLTRKSDSIDDTLRGDLLILSMCLSKDGIN